MSLRCSLLGHEYGESEIERDREERGDEVVISVSELERCRRCGNTRVISENTEVTQRQRHRQRQRSPEPEREPRADARTEPEPEPEPESEPEPGTEGWLAEARAFETDSALGADDAEIMEETPEDDRQRDPGAWPEYDDPTDAGAESETEAGGSDRSAEWPTVEGEDEGFDATVPDGERTDVEFGGGLTPQANQGAEIMEGATSEDRGGEDADAEFVRAQGSLPSDRSADLEGETELYCPNCDTSDLDERDSLRAGDICPVCHRGYLGEREIERGR